MTLLLLRENRRHHYLLAVALPVAVTAVTWFLHGYLTAANITLIYIVAVIVTAVNTGTKPALVSALVSFLAFNLSFTEPRGSLFVLHSQDMLTAGLFLITAITVGQLAARVKEHLEQVQERERFSRVELDFLEQLATAIDPRQITGALTTAIARLPELDSELVSLEQGAPCWERVRIPVPEALRRAIEAPLQVDPANPERQSWQADDHVLLLLDDGRQAIAGLLVVSHASSALDWIRLLANQANLALARTRLVADLEAERTEKENELMRSSLLSSVSHDFRTPLTSMVGAASTLLELDAQLSEPQKKELLESILSEARRLNSYTQKLLDMTRLGRGQLRLHRTTVAIDEIFNVVLKRIRQQFPGHSIETAIPDDLPAVSVHAALIEQALLNVLENACKFSPLDKPIRVTCRALNDRLLIEVEDSGPGIPDAEKTKVFEMFHAADRGDCRAAGSGLGLSICKGMIGAHGGSVEIGDSSRLGGSLVRIELPALAPNPEEQPQ